MNSNPNVAELQTPADHVRVLHGDARVGTVTIARRAGRWRERSVPLRDLDRYVRAVPVGPGTPDTYMSQARFSGRRLVARLVTVSSLWLDLDYYRIPALASLSPAEVMAAVFRRCDGGIAQRRSLASPRNRIEEVRRDRAHRPGSARERGVRQTRTFRATRKARIDGGRPPGTARTTPSQGTRPCRPQRRAPGQQSEASEARRGG